MAPGEGNPASKPKRINCPLCMDSGGVDIQNPVPSSVDGIDFDYTNKVPCPVCPAGYRMQLATEQKARRLDQEQS